jgi:hypothetical protein
MFEGLRSTSTKLAGVFRKGRDTWKARAADKQRRLKALAGKVSDLTRSRDQWKAEAKQLREQLQRLETRPRSSPSEFVGTTPAVVGPCGHSELTAPPFCPPHAVRASRLV